VARPGWFKRWPVQPVVATRASERWRWAWRSGATASLVGVAMLVPGARQAARPDDRVRRGGPYLGRLVHEACGARLGEGVGCPGVVVCCVPHGPGSGACHRAVWVVGGAGCGGADEAVMIGRAGAVEPDRRSDTRAAHRGDESAAMHEPKAERATPVDRSLRGSDGVRDTRSCLRPPGHQRRSGGPQQPHRGDPGHCCWRPSQPRAREDRPRVPLRTLVVPPRPCPPPDLGCPPENRKRSFVLLGSGTCVRG
jgi:hypothetical protein